MLYPNYNSDITADDQSLEPGSDPIDLAEF